MDLSGLKRHGIHEREALVDRAILAEVTAPGATVEAFLASLPDVLAVRSLREVAREAAVARAEGRPVVLAMGAHAVKCGLAPVIVDMISREIITSVAMNGAAAIHDLEMAMVGETSEDVTATIADGSFGMVRETAEAFAAALAAGGGLGAALGGHINEEGMAHADESILGRAVAEGIPVTVHVAIGTDVVHMHPEIDAGALGRATHQDFRAFCDVVAALEGGVYLNLGSAVILPEVFLKALSVARNLTGGPGAFTACDMDMIRQYRPQQNVLARTGSRAHAITGHHEINLPLLRMAILAAMAGGER